MIKKMMKKIGIISCLVFAVCFMTGCGNDGTEERLKTGEERALELSKDAQNAVDQVDEDTMNLQENEKSIEEE